MEGISFGRPIITMNEVITLAKKNWKVYAFWVLFCEVVGAASGFLSMSGMEIYTATAVKPPLTPPPWVFPVVWTILFALMGISAARISLTAESKERSRALLEKRVAQAKDTSEVYDENNDYREAFVMDVLYTATKEALKQDAKEQTVELTLQLSYQDGTWWVVADEKLLDAISGGILY